MATDALTEKAIVLRAEDDVAIAKQELAAGTVLEDGEGRLVVRRVIGGGVVGTAGTPVEVLGKLIHRTRFSALWTVRDELTRIAKEKEAKLRGEPLPGPEALPTPIEGGAEPFSEPPYYDPEALQGGRVILAAFTMASGLGAGQQHVATIHVAEPVGATTPAVQVMAAADPDGVASMTLWYSVNNGAWQSAAMTLGGDRNHTGTIPGQGAGAVVQFYVEGQDALGAVSTFPAEGAASRALYKVGNSANSATLHNLQIIMTSADATALGAAPLIRLTGPVPFAPQASRAFHHGVASGDPLPDRVLLWTRVEPPQPV